MTQQMTRELCLERLRHMILHPEEDKLTFPRFPRLPFRAIQLHDVSEKNQWRGAAGGEALQALMLKSEEAPDSLDEDEADAAKRAIAGR